MLSLMIKSYNAMQSNVDEQMNVPHKPDLTLTIKQEFMENQVKRLQSSKCSSGNITNISFVCLHAKNQ